MAPGDRTGVERIDVAVIGAGVTGLAAARAIAAARRVGVRARASSAPGPRHQHAQQRRHSRRHLLPGRLAQGAAVRRRARVCCTSSAPTIGVPHVAAASSSSRTTSARSQALEDAAAARTRQRRRRARDRRRAFIAAREPAVHAVARCARPTAASSTPRRYVKALLRTGEAAGVIFLPATRVVGAEPLSRRHRAADRARNDPRAQVVNAAGLYADEVSRMLGGETFTIYPCRGEYAELTPRQALARERSGLSAAARIRPRPRRAPGADDSAAQVWLGPTIRYQDRKDDYENDRLPLEAFAGAGAAVCRGVTLDDLRLSGSGIRAKLHPPTESFADFLIRRDRSNRRSFRRPASTRQG